jgi:hypothetical protein
MDRRKALKTWHFTGTALSSSTIGFYLKVYTSENEKIKCFRNRDEEILAEFADIIIPTTNSLQELRQLVLVLFQL